MLKIREGGIGGIEKFDMVHNDIIIGVALTVFDYQQTVKKIYFYKIVSLLVRNFKNRHLTHRCR